MGLKQIEVQCDQPLEGRYVEVKIPGNRKVLTLCEVLVFKYDREYKLIFLMLVQGNLSKNRFIFIVSH